ncbi:transcription factor/nuclear export subunit protein 2-domain-containing protein [Lasiosphaeris hirsuta]|uniref:THO complex subunit 2 n=1 Tax=Lasiosphaeris hirsuta TaxID=260670 RepID=A0AA40DSU4_9PEZI|nr:transcription factor/nuclear export subunit protein 2-domain-containing protein [Lasiosphaeris hirsuta]
MPAKRKRPGDSGAPRPSPHRPSDTTLGQHDRNYDSGGRGGRGGRSSRRPDRRDSAQSFNAGPPPSAAPPGPISPTLGRPSSSSSSTAIPLPAVQMAPAPVAPSPPLPPIQPGYYYSIVTDERVDGWAKGARQEVIDHGIQSREDEDLIEVTAIFQELLHSVIDGRLLGADAGGVVKDILGPEPSEAERNNLIFDPHSLFLDTVSTFMDVESGPYRPQLRDFMIATDVSPALVRQVLDPPILKDLGLIRDSFARMGVRQATNLLYRQANYNLLREETEGFSKLITELFTTSSAEPPSSEVVQAAFNKVMGLIGTFDLHPGRVLDVTLDIFAAVLIKQFRFFIKFLRVSSWWPRTQIKPPAGTYVGGLPVWAFPEHSNWFASEEEEATLAAERLRRDIAFWERARKIKLDAFFELGGRQLSASEEQRLANGPSEGQETDIEQEWMKLTRTLPPSGNRDAAQMLGFKLRFYTSEARDEDDVLPANLLYLIALLIKVGFISLTDLWNHIWPKDEEMESVRVRKMKELEEKEKQTRSGGALNALMTAGALPDDMPSSSNMPRRDTGPSKPDTDGKATAEAEEKPKLPPPDDQKAVLLKCLLTIGAIPESLFIIGRHDWILPAHPDLMPLVYRVLHHSVETVFQQSHPVASRPADNPPKKLPDLNQSGVAKGSIKLSTPPTKRALRWPYPDEAGTNEGGGYRFYWDEWADNVPVCQTVDDIFTLCDTLLNIVGVNIGQDAALVAKLTRIGNKSLADDPSPENRARWLDLLKRLLVPSLSLSDTNSSVVESVWTLLKQYPLHVRYNVYAEWYEGATSRLEPIKKAFARTRLETLANMKRLSLTNIPKMAKVLAKIAYPSPGILCKVALLQIESYSNLIDAFVECVKYFTDLGYDVLVWSVLSSIGGQRSRTQADSVLLTSKWLQALSKFSGKVFQRYSNMDPVPILRYVNDQLYKGNSTDLLILRELIESMGGVVSDLDFTDAQLRAMTGGEILRRETLVSLGDKRSVSIKSSDRFIRSLVDTKLAGRLLINIAQYRQNAIFKVLDADAHIKYLSTVVDDTHQILLQYLDLIRSNIDGDTFNSLVPDIIQLMRDFGLGPGLAFMIGRASLRLDIKVTKALKESQVHASRTVTDTDGDIAMDTDHKADTTDDNNPSKIVNGRKGDPLVDALQPLIDGIPSVLTDQSWRYISPVCYVFFWSLQLGDFAFPQESYAAESQKLLKQAEEVMKDRSDMTRVGMNKKTQKRKDILDRQKLLTQENADGVERYSKTKLQIAKHLNTWFPADITKADATSDALLEECILPRLQLSPLDAEYSFRLIKFLHEFSAPNFKLMSLYDRLFNHNRLRAIIFTCTVREAEHLGRFLKCILSDLSRWHGDKNAYEKEALGSKEMSGKRTRQYLSFATTFDAEGKPTAFIEHDAYRDLLFRWHKELNTALRSCLNGMEWMHIRNAITILKSVIDFFPAINFMADKFLEQLKTISEREAASKGGSDSEQGHRVDLSVTAQTTFSELQRRKSKWILVQAFRPGPSGDSKDDRNSSSVPPNSALRASAPEFKLPSTGRNVDVEDGEVKDSKGVKNTNGPFGAKEIKQQPLPTREPLKDASAGATQRGSTIPGKPTTPKPSAALPVSTSGSRLDSSGRSSTLPSGGHNLPSRPELPSRPDVPQPGLRVHVHADRFNHNRPDRRDMPPRESRDFRDAREPRDPRDTREPLPRDGREPLGTREGRDYRGPENSRTERPRDFPPTDRHAVEPSIRETPRPEREWPSRVDVPPRWNDHGPPPERDGRPPRDRAPPHGPSRHDPRPSREHVATSTPPPSAVPHKDASEPSINPDRVRQLSDVDRPEIINPARAALITDTRDIPRSARTSLAADTRDVPRSSSRDIGRERPSRTDSPRRPDQSAPGVPQLDSARDDRHSRHRHSEYRDSAREGHGDSAPSHPRSDRVAEREPDKVAAFRDQPHGGPPVRGPDPDHGRLNHDDPNYGRLNTIPSVADVPPGPPSGPRGRGRNTARINPVNGPPIRNDNRFNGPDPLRPPSPERHPPTGPSSTRPRRGQYDNNSNVNSPTSSGPPSGTGVHPDRVRQINHQQPPSTPAATTPPPPPPPPPPAPAAPSGIHPDRLNQIGAAPQPTGPSSMSRPPMNNTPDRPSVSAPNSGVRPPPLNTDFSTPTGPSASNDRMRPGGSRQLRGIQNTLEKASADSSRGPNTYRGRQRTNLAGSDAQILAGSSPVTTPVHERPDPIRDVSRHDMSTDRAPRGPEPIQVVGDSRDGRTLRNSEEYNAARGDHERSSRRDHHRSDRSNRPSRRSSRERSPDREREVKDGREHRERRVEPSTGTPSSTREGERDAGSSRRSMRDPTGAGRESLPGSREMAPPRESSHRSHRGDVPPGPRDGLLPTGRSDSHGGRSGSLGGRGEEYGNGSRGGSSRGAGAPRDSRSRPVDDRVDPRGDLRGEPRGDDRGRKRRSEGGIDPSSGHPDKRPRR